MLVNSSEILCTAAMARADLNTQQRARNREHDHNRNREHEHKHECKHSSEHKHDQEETKCAGRKLPSIHVQAQGQLKQAADLRGTATVVADNKRGLVRFKVKP